MTGCGDVLLLGRLFPLGSQAPQLGPVYASGYPGVKTEDLQPSQRDKKHARFLKGDGDEGKCEAFEELVRK